jgi:hypothetical protein
MDKLKGIPTEKGLIVFMDLGEKWEINHSILTGKIVEGRDGPYIRVEYWDFAWSKNSQEMFYHNSGSGPISGFDLPMGSTYWVSPSIESHVFEGGRTGNEPFKIDSNGERVTDPCKRLSLPEFRKLFKFPAKQIFEKAEHCDSGLIWCGQCESRVYVDWQEYSCPHLEWCDDCGEWYEIGGAEEVCSHLKGQLVEQQN